MNNVLYIKVYKAKWTIQKKCFGKDWEKVEKVESLFFHHKISHSRELLHGIKGIFLEDEGGDTRPQYTKLKGGISESFDATPRGAPPKKRSIRGERSMGKRSARDGGAT